MEEQGLAIKNTFMDKAYPKWYLFLFRIFPTSFAKGCLD